MLAETFDRSLTKVEKLLTNISWSVCLLVTVLIIVDVFGRFFLDRPLPGTWEVSEVLMPFIIFFPFAYTCTLNAHVQVSLVRDRVPPKIRFGFDVFSNLVSFVACGALAYYSWFYFWESFQMNEEIMAAVQIPWWPGKMAMPIGMAVFALRYLMRALIQAGRYDSSAERI